MNAIRRGLRLVTAVVALELVACDQTPTRPDAAAQFRGRAIALTIDVGAGTVRQVGIDSVGGVDSRLRFSIIGQHEVAASVNNVTRTALAGQRVLVRFDLALTNQLQNSDLVPSTFPAPPVQQVVAFPFSTTPPGLFGQRVLASDDWDGAPWNFFNDVNCTPSSPTSDCFRWEAFGTTVPAGATTGSQTVGFTADARLTSFTVLIAVAADIREGPPRPPPPLPFPPGTVFVTPTGDDAAAGDVGSPVRTIAHAIALVVARGGDRVVVAVGVYPGSFHLANGVSVLGGYDPGFTKRDLDAYRAVLTVAPLEPVTSTIRCESITAATVLEGFTIVGPDVATPGASSYAIHLSDCGAALAIQNNVIIGGRGADGADGQGNGRDGANGQNGEAGQAAVSYDVSGPVPVRLGGRGGVLITFFGDDISGGSGGNGSEPFLNQFVANGLRGRSTFSPGFGGIGGASGQWSATLANSLVLPQPPLQLAGTNGQDGGDSFDGFGGGGGGAIGTFIGGEWFGAAGQLGGRGGDGGGGGGGGASGGGEDDKQNPPGPPDPFVGATGGGGGSGGGGGEGGSQGEGGGGSFGILMSFSAPPATLPSITGNVIHIGRGGRGGSGRSGGTGGIGGLGGPGGSSGGIFAAVPGGAGGKGGNGGPGGGGGGGGGGLACGIGAGLLGVAAPDWAALNTIDTRSGAGGAGGRGALSLRNPAGDGATGDARAVSTF